MSGWFSQKGFYLCAMYANLFFDFAIHSSAVMPEDKTILSIWEET